VVDRREAIFLADEGAAFIFLGVLSEVIQEACGN
jgi:hypothetical protein